MLIIDTHAHIYSDDEKRYPPIDKPLRPPGMKGTLGDLRATSASHGVRAACLIQVSTFYRFDNRYVCDCAKVSSDWAAGVCTLDPDDPHSPELLSLYRREYGIKGMRSIPGRSGRIDDRGVRDLWKKAADENLVVNALIHRENAENLGHMLADFPNLRVVLDHCMYPEIGPHYDAVLNDVLRLARFKNLHAKLTFVPMGTKQNYPCADIHDAVMKFVEAFGADRCVWGGDFPCELWTPGISYSQHLQIFMNEIPHILAIFFKGFYAYFIGLSPDLAILPRFTTRSHLCSLASYFCWSRTDVLPGPTSKFNDFRANRWYEPAWEARNYRQNVRNSFRGSGSAKNPGADREETLVSRVIGLVWHMCLAQRCRSRVPQGQPKIAHGFNRGFGRQKNINPARGERKRVVTQHFFRP